MNRLGLLLLLALAAPASAQISAPIQVYGGESSVAANLAYPVGSTTFFSQASTPTASQFFVILTSGTIGFGDSAGGVVINEGNQSGNGLLILDNGDAAGGGAMPATKRHLRVYSNNTNNNQPLIESEDTSTSGASANFKASGPDADFEFVGTGTSCYGGHCKWEITLGNNSDDISIQGRNGNASAFEKVVSFHIWSSSIASLTQYNPVGSMNEITISSVGVIRAMSSNASTSWTGIAFSTSSIDSKNHLWYWASTGATSVGIPMVELDADHHLGFPGYMNLTSTFTQVMADPSGQKYMFFITSGTAAGNNLSKYMLAVATTGAVMVNTSVQNAAMLAIDYYGNGDNTGHGIVLMRSGTQVGYLDTNSNTDIVLKGNSSKGAQIRTNSSTVALQADTNGNVSMGGGASAAAPCSTCTVVAMGSLWQNLLFSCTTGTQTDATGRFSACVASSRKLKTDIRPFVGMGIERLRPVYFKWNKEERLARDAQQHVGFIAEEVGEVLPQAVVPAGGKDGKDLGIDDKSVMAIMVNEIKSLKKSVRKLQRENEVHK